MSWTEEQNNEDKSKQQEIIEMGNIPKHVAIIMDGNGRWAMEQGKTRTFGHQEGISSVRDIVKASSQVGIKYLTLYAFSLENWKRPLTEVNVLMKLLESYLRSELDELHENNVKMQSIGKQSSLPKIVQRLLHYALDKTKDNTGLTLTLALSYSGRWDIVRAVQMIGLDVRRGKLSPEDINEDMFSSYLQTSSMPGPDLLIRTSGEMRLSNFLLWEMAYGEMYITDKYWPEFRRDDLYLALCSYMKRERRFGKTSAQVAHDNLSGENNSFINRVLNAFKSK